jgi:hypothetical protein
MCMCPIPNGFRDVAISLYSAKKLLIRKRYYILFLIPVFTVQVAKLVQFTLCNIVSKISPTISLCNSCEDFNADFHC